MSPPVVVSQARVISTLACACPLSTLRVRLVNRYVRKAGLSARRRTHVRLDAVGAGTKNGGASAMSGNADNGGGVARRTVFLSYAREDQAQAAKLAKALEESGLDVWWDTLIHSGAEFSKSIEAALEKCDAVVVAWSRASVRSDWVLDEASRGRDLRKLVPLSLDGTAPPLGFR